MYFFIHFLNQLLAKLSASTHVVPKSFQWVGALRETPGSGVRGAASSLSLHPESNCFLPKVQDMVDPGSVVYTQWAGGGSPWTEDQTDQTDI